MKSLVKVVSSEEYSKLIEDLGAKVQYVDIKVGFTNHTAIVAYNSDLQIQYSIIPIYHATSIINNTVLADE